MNLVKIIFLAIALLFLGLGAMRLMRDGGKWHPQSKTWFLTGGIFALVSAWLWMGVNV